jgi:hypothetical protein
MESRVFLSELEELINNTAEQAPNRGCLDCQNVVASTNCMFSKNLDNCYRCTHCNDCSNCAELSHSNFSDFSNNSAYLVHSRYCNASAYLTHCVGCSQCTYCFGCVGLMKKDFHILNVPYPRSEYFDIVNTLKKQLRL